MPAVGSATFTTTYDLVCESTAVYDALMAHIQANSGSYAVASVSGTRVLKRIKLVMASQSMTVES